MTSLTLKWIAIITMIIDHIGLVFFPEIQVLRIIGRISFPIFAFLLVQGYLKTSSLPRYLFRLGLFAIISEVPYDLMRNNTYLEFGRQNILVLLFFGLLSLYFLDFTFKKKNPLYLIGLILSVIAVVFLNPSYSLYGISIILAFFLFRKYRGADVLAFLGLTYLFYGVMSWGFTAGAQHYEILQLNQTQLYGFLAAIPIVFYNNKPGRGRGKWIFYIFYPAHMAIIWGLNYLLTTYL